MAHNSDDGRELCSLPPVEFISELLQCPVCLGIPLPPVWLCTSGHSTCDACRNQMDVCGLCRGHFTGGRNIVAEAIILQSKLSCPYKGQGCKEACTGSTIQVHEQNCPFGPKIRWVKCWDTSPLPMNAVLGGYQDGINLYVIRAPHEYSNTPGKLFEVVPPNGSHKASLCWGGGEHFKTTYEVLVAPEGSLKWEKSSGGVSVPKAVPGGFSETGETLFIGRGHYNNGRALVVGKIHPSHGVCYIAYGNEKALQNYEILVQAI